MSLNTEMKNVVDIQGTLCLPVRIFFVKEGPSKYMSHLDLMRCMTRTLRRAGVPIWYTEGFNPHPFMTFAMPLSLGTSGLCETMTAIKSAVYRITLDCEGMTGEELGKLTEQYLSQESILVQKKNKKKQLVDIDVKPHVLSYEVTHDGECALLTIQLPAGNDVNINPNIILKGLEAANSLTFDKCEIVRERILTENGDFE